MDERRFYQLLLVISFVAPWALLILYFTQGGGLLTLIPDAFANLVSSSVFLDALCTAIIFWYFGVIEGRRIGMKFCLSLYIPLTLFVGLGIALSLFLLQRHLHMKQIVTI